VLIEELARAKVNLTLTITGRRADGYHELASVVAFASVADTVTLDTARPPAVEVRGPFASALASEYLIANTLRVLGERAPRLRQGAVLLDKRLPVAAGIGGGSADAAAVLRAVRAANPDVADDVDWPGIALRLGADVPVCLANRLSYVTGIGERVEALPDLAPIMAVLVNPLVAVPADKTAQVFRALNAADLHRKDAPAPPELRDRTDVVRAIAEIGNALEGPAQRVLPVVGEVLADLRSLPGCAVAAMSGAGPTCFAIVTDAQSAAAALRAARPSWWAQAVTLS
jgi:4-diphosphocytidyl-2-C-methyl-D-erythritol kinase